MKYRTIVADPPWPYESRYNGQLGQNVPMPYPTMGISDIKDMPVADLSARDVSGQRRDKSVRRDGSVLYLWTTTRFICEAHDIARCWNFTPTVVLVWCKTPIGVGGPGGTFKSNVEFIIVARRGSPPPSATVFNTRWFQWPRGKHSAKPEAFLDLVEQVSPGPYLELFARRQRIGWDSWGNECRCDVEMPATS